MLLKDGNRKEPYDPMLKAVKSKKHTTHFVLFKGVNPALMAQDEPSTKYFTDGLELICQKRIHQLSAYTV